MTWRLGWERSRLDSVSQGRVRGTRRERKAGERCREERLGEWQAVAVPESVPKLRRALLAAIRGRGFPDMDVGLAATEALSNVVRHAYPDGEGPVALTAEASPTELVVVVADEGVGARSFELSSIPGLGIGLRLIHELCHSATVEPTSDGTTVTMTFITDESQSCQPWLGVLKWARLVTALSSLFARKGAAMADSDVTVTHLGGDRWVIALDGEHDISTVSHFQDELDRVFATGTSLVLDLSDATFIDSSVIRTLLAAHQRAQATTGEQLAIVAPPGGIAERVLDLTGLQASAPHLPNQTSSTPRHRRGLSEPRPARNTRTLRGHPLTPSMTRACPAWLEPRRSLPSELHRRIVTASEFVAHASSLARRSSQRPIAWRMSGAVCAAPRRGSPRSSSLRRSVE